MNLLMALLQEHGKDYNKIAESLESKTATQVRFKCNGLKRGEGAGSFDIDEGVMQILLENASRIVSFTWTVENTELLLALLKQHGKNATALSDGSNGDFTKMQIHAKLFRMTKKSRTLTKLEYRRHF